MTAAKQKQCARMAREAVAMACRLVGQKRGFALAAQHLGTSESVVHAIHYRRSARPNPQHVAEACITLGDRLRAQLAAEDAATAQTMDEARRMLARLRADQLLEDTRGTNGTSVALDIAEAHPCG